MGRLHLAKRRAVPWILPKREIRANPVGTAEASAIAACCTGPLLPAGLIAPIQAFPPSTPSASRGKSTLGEFRERVLQSLGADCMVRAKASRCSGFRCGCDLGFCNRSGFPFLEDDSHVSIDHALAAQTLQNQSLDLLGCFVRLERPATLRFPEFHSQSFREEQRLAGAGCEPLAQSRKGSAMEGRRGSAPLPQAGSGWHWELCSAAEDAVGADPAAPPWRGRQEKPRPGSTATER